MSENAPGKADQKRRVLGVAVIVVVVFLLFIAFRAPTDTQPASIEWPSISFEGVSLSYLADWDIQTFTDEQEPTIILESPGGSFVFVLPNGGFAYGFDPETTRRRTLFTLAGFPAARSDYFDSSGNLFVSRISFDPPLPGLPDFRLEFRPESDDFAVKGFFERILRSLEVQSSLGSTSTGQTPVNTVLVPTKVIDTSDWQVYNDPYGKYSFKYPPDGIVVNLQRIQNYDYQKENAFEGKSEHYFIEFGLRPGNGCTSEDLEKRSVGPEYTIYTATNELVAFVARHDSICVLWNDNVQSFSIGISRPGNTTDEDAITLREGILSTLYLGPSP